MRQIFGRRRANPGTVSSSGSGFQPVTEGNRKYLPFVAGKILPATLATNGLRYPKDPVVAPAGTVLRAWLNHVLDAWHSRPGERFDPKEQLHRRGLWSSNEIPPVGSHAAATRWEKNEGMKLDSVSRSHRASAEAGLAPQGAVAGATDAAKGEAHGKRRNRVGRAKRSPLAG